jgi:hypothetical protein
MSEKKGWGSSVLGLFVVRDEKGAGEEPAVDAADAATAAASPSDSADAAAGADPNAANGANSATAGNSGIGAGDAPGAASGAFVHDPPAAPGGKVDFAAVYSAAGIDAEEQAQVTKAAELLHALPGGSEPARQIVEASLRAFGVPVEKILAAGEKELRALDAYVAAGAADSRKVLAESQQRIGQYEQEIQRIRQVMDQRVAEQQGVERACAGGKLEVARVLAFFGHAPAGAAAPQPPQTPPATPDKPSERSA